MKNQAQNLNVAERSYEQMPLLDSKPADSTDTQLLNRAKELIDAYCLQEFGTKADYHDLSKIGIAYTTVTDTIDIQVYVDLETYCIKKYLDGEKKIVECRQYDSLSDLIDGELEYLDFSELVSIPIPEEDIEHFLGKEEEKTDMDKREEVVLDSAMEPIVTVIWSENPQLKDGQQMPLHEANTMFGCLDRAHPADGTYDKTKFRIDFIMNGQQDTYDGRQDFGDGDGSLIQHIQGYHEYYDKSEDWKNHILKEQEQDAWEEDKAYRDILLHEFVPYLELHCNLGAMEQEANRALQSGKTLTLEQTAYFNAVLDHVKECRLLLNQGKYQLPEPPHLADFDQRLQEYKLKVQKEIEQEAENYGMTVEEYAENGYEPPVKEEQIQEAGLLTELQIKAREIAVAYQKLPMHEKIGMIAQVFGCTSGKIVVSSRGNGISDMFIEFDNGTSLFIGYQLTPKAKTLRAQNKYIDDALVNYNPEIIKLTKETAMAVLMPLQEKDNKIAAQKGLKPYTLLGVEFVDGTDKRTKSCMGWYYVILAVDGKIRCHRETGLKYAIADGKARDYLYQEKYYIAGGLKEPEVDYVFHNVGFSSTSELYTIELSDTVRERAEQTLLEKLDTYAIYQLKEETEMRKYLFKPYAILQETGLAVNKQNYDLIYKAPLDKGNTLENIYCVFNIDHPEDYTGRSLSVSDVVVLTRNGESEAYYCDRIGFKQVPEFFSPASAIEPGKEQEEASPDDLEMGEWIKTPRGTFSVTAMSKEQIEAAGYSIHHQSDDGRYLIMANGTRAFAIDARKEEEKMEKRNEQQEEVCPVGSLQTGCEAKEDTILEAEENQKAATRYYEINEEAARRAKEANSFSDYRPGSATDTYRRYVDRAVEIANRQKKRVDPMYHDKIDSLLDTYARKLAENMNQSFSIEARVPSVLIAGPANFPVRKKEKQNAARESNMKEWQYIQGLLDKIRSTGMGGIRQDDPQAIQKLKEKLSKLEKLQATMKEVNAYYRKHKTLDGCQALSEEQIARLKSDMAEDYHLGNNPFLPYQLANNNAEIRRIKQRIATIEKEGQKEYEGWEFDGGRVEANREDSRLQVFFDEKPDIEERTRLKENGFRWAPKAGAWQRLLNSNAYQTAKRIDFLKPLA